MAIAPIPRLKRSEIEYLHLHRCKAHGHRFIEHYGCYLVEQAQEPQKIGFFDIETSNFEADWSVLLSYSILDDKTDVIYGRAITPKELSDPKLDTGLLVEMVRDMKRFDQIVGYYSTKFDLPYARTRAMIQKVAFPTFGELQHKDVYYIIKSKFAALSRRRQEIAAKMALGKTEKTHIQPDVWMRAVINHDQASLDYIFDHNNRDVRDLKGIYHKVMPFVKNGTKSI